MNERGGSETSTWKLTEEELWVKVLYRRRSTTSEQ